MRYAIQDKELSKEEIRAVARDFEDAVAEVLLKKTKEAVSKHGIKSLILGGGVSANTFLRQTFTEHFKAEESEVKLYLPNPKLSTDNSVMIALAGHARAKEALEPETATDTIVADGNRSLSQEV